MKHSLSLLGFVQIVEDEGMPVHEVPSEKGNLFIEYNILFPESLTSEQETGNCVQMEVEALC